MVGKGKQLYNEGLPTENDISKWDPAQMKERCWLPWKNMG
jgi:hypothetical protein